MTKDGGAASDGTSDTLVVAFPCDRLTQSVARGRHCGGNVGPELMAAGRGCGVDMRWSVRLLLAVLVLTSVVSAAGCFDVKEAPPPTPTPQGTISGRILVADAVGATVRSDAKRPVASLPTPVRAKPPKLEWVAGDAVVLFDRAVHNRQSLDVTLQRTVVDAGLAEKVRLEVDRCSVQLCLVRLRDLQGVALDVASTDSVVAALHARKAAGVRRIGRNIMHRGFRIPNDELASQQWHYDQVKLPAAWDLTIGDPNLVVAVLDSGVVHANPDLRDKLARAPDNPNTFVEFDFVDRAFSNDGDGPDFSAEDPGDNLFGNDEGEDSFHGTHVAGTVGAETNNRTGVAGVLWEAQILPVRVLGDQLGGTEFDILTGLYWAVGAEIELTPPNQKPARIVNLSLGAPSSVDGDETWEAVIADILANPEGVYSNAVIVCAAGNSAIDARQITPANIEALITVGATRLDGLRADYSNFGPAIDVMAPGGQLGIDQNQDEIDDGVLSTWGVDVRIEQGTSMSAPHVAGIAGLIVSANPELTHEQVHNLIRGTADIRFRCNEGCGEGIVDPVQALLAAGVTLEPQPRLSLGAQRLFFNGGISVRTLSILNLGSVDAAFTAAITGAQAQLFSVDSVGGDLTAGDDVELTVTLDRAQFTAGSATLVLTGTGAADGQVVSASLDFDDLPNRGRRGLEEVEVGVFTRAGDGNLVRVGTEVALRANGFTWSVSGLTVGSYEVYAVGDDNGDGTFDRVAESSGAYPLRDGVQQVVIEDEGTPVEEINFAVSLPFTPPTTDGVGGTCTPDTDTVDCAGVFDFAPDAGCIGGFPGGYCSRICDDGICGANARCDVLECEGEPCNVCLKTCVSDSQCRSGYLCVFDTCVPEGFDG